MKYQFSKFFFAFIAIAVSSVFFSTPAHADIFGGGLTTIFSNIVHSLNTIPGLIAAICYLLGILFGFRGILKTKEHVENSNNVGIRVPVIHFIVGGGLFAFPTILEAVVNTIDPTNTVFNPTIDSVGETAEVLGVAGTVTGINSFSVILSNIAYSLSNTPLLIYAFSYLAGLIMVFLALIKLKEYVEDENKTQIRVPVIRFLIGGALLTIPSIFNAMAESISPSYETYSFLDILVDIFYVADTLDGSLGSTSASFNQISNNVVASVSGFPAFLSYIAYLLGLIFGISGLLKIKDHIEDERTPLKDGVVRLFIGGGLFAFPVILTSMVYAVDPLGTLFAESVAADTGDAASGNTFNLVFNNIIYALSSTPLLVYTFSYLAGLIMGFLALIKLKEYVEDENKTNLKVPLIRFFIGGALFVLPTLFNAMAESISPTYNAYSFFDIISGIFSGTSLYSTDSATVSGNVNQILNNILGSTSSFPTLVTYMAYFLGLVIGVSGLLKIKDHVEDERTPLKEGVIRLFVGGALFASQVIFAAILYTITGVGDVISLFGSGEALACSGSGSNLGGIICNLFTSTTVLPYFLVIFAYFGGTAVGIWAILQFQEHILNPQQTKFWDPFSKLLVAGGLFSLPTIITIATDTVAGGLTGFTTPKGFNETVEPEAKGLDILMSNLMTNIYDPMIFMIEWFGIIAGLILIFIGISRFLKSSQEGAKGPGGIGTIMTFIAGGALVSFSPFVGSFLTSVFLDSSSQTFASLTYDAGMSEASIARANTVIASIFRFVLILGLISIMRGIFIIRGVSEGNSQASMMAGITHVVGGALAVNLGGLIEATQNTLGITAYGLSF